MIIYLFRHGRSKANEGRLVTGTQSDVLSREGIEQTKRMADWIKRAGFNADRYVTSQWKRAQQTAKILWPEENWEFDSRVGETDAGEAADWSLQHFQDNFPDFYTDPTHTYPGGESHLQLNQRVIAWLSMQFTRPCERLVLVSHSGPISCILQHVTGLEMSVFPAFLPGNASLSIIEIFNKSNVLSGDLLMFSAGPVKNLKLGNL